MKKKILGIVAVILVFSTVFAGGAFAYTKTPPGKASDIIRNEQIKTEYSMTRVNNFFSEIGSKIAIFVKNQIQKVKEKSVAKKEKQQAQEEAKRRAEEQRQKAAEAKKKAEEAAKKAAEKAKQEAEKMRQKVEEQKRKAKEWAEEHKKKQEEQQEVTPVPVQTMPEKKMAPGRWTVKNFLLTTLAPVGKVLWVTGGGWAFNDHGPDAAACSIGMSQKWLDFFNEQDADYDRNTTEPKVVQEDPYVQENTYHEFGLDADGYVGWAIYNTLNHCSGHSGFVGTPDELVESLECYCNFESTKTLLNKDPVETAKTLKPGDFVILPGRHMYVYLGGCEDGSFLVAHSAVCDSKTGAPGGGVQISAVSVGATKDCEAYELAQQYMALYPEWPERYDILVKDTNVYLNFYDYAVGPEPNGIFRWKVLADCEGYRSKTAKEVLADLYK